MHKSAKLEFEIFLPLISNASFVLKGVAITSHCIPLVYGFESVFENHNGKYIYIANRPTSLIEPQPVTNRKGQNGRQNIKSPFIYLSGVLALLAVLKV